MSIESAQDPLDEEIAAVRRVMIAAQHTVEIQGAILASLERVKAAQGGVKSGALISRHPARSIAPSTTVINGDEQPKHIGKAPGAIGMKWREIMAKMVANGNQPMQADMWSLAASEAGHTVPPKTAGDWLRRSSDNEYGYILRHGDSYNVSQGAIEKFNLKASEPPLEVASDSSA